MAIQVQAACFSRVHPALPIFRVDDDQRVLFYTPGHVAAASPAQAAAVVSMFETGSADSDTNGFGHGLIERARAAQQSWRELTERAFEPECLTLYLSNRCNLGCSYCYAAPADPDKARTRLRLLPTHEAAPGFPVLAEEAAYAAARFVARCAAAKSRPLTLVLHGGGEPTLHWDLLQRVYAHVRTIALDHGVPFRTYIATHGVLSDDRARWLARRFTQIGLSCDGPPDIQNANRPSSAGAATSARVEATSRLFVEEGASFTVRATITPATVRRQSEIVRYAHDRLGASTVRFEPAYHGRDLSRQHFQPADADEFVEHFLEACDVARANGCDLRVSGVRIDEIHGPYCHPLRQVLQVGPDNGATACFLTTGSGDPEDAVMAVGRWDRSTGEFTVDSERAAALRRRAARIPARCESCVNIYHCARDCPDVCVITADPREEQQQGFRCRVHQLLGPHWIRTMSPQPGALLPA
jgi:uncharacterized protein